MMWQAEQAACHILALRILMRLQRHTPHLLQQSPPLVGTKQVPQPPAAINAIMMALINATNATRNKSLMPHETSRL